MQFFKFLKIILFLDVVSIFSPCRGILTFIERLTQNDKKEKKERKKTSLYQSRKVYIIERTDFTSTLKILTTSK